MQTILKAILGVFALLFLVYGGAFMFAPGYMLETFALDPASYTKDPALAWSTVRGDMGALFLTLAVAIGLGVATTNKTWLQAAMLLLGLIFIGRVVGVIIHGGGDQIYINMGGEAVCVLALWLYSRGLD